MKRFLVMSSAVVVMLACLDATEPTASGIQVSDPLVAFSCRDARALSLAPNALWLPTDTPLTRTVLVTLDRRLKTPCTYDLLNTDTLSPDSYVESVDVSGDSLLWTTLRGTRPSLKRMFIALNGKVLSSVELIMASRAFSAAAIGHRGAGSRWPENTLLALRAAGTAGLLGSEIDVRLTMDSVPILMHDPDVNRTTNGSGLVEQMRASQVSALDAGARFNPRFAGETVPLLREALIVSGVYDLPLFLDVKPTSVVAPPTHAAILVTLVMQAEAENRVTLLSPSREFLRAARQMSATISLGLTQQAPRTWNASFSEEVGASAILYLSVDSLFLPQFAGILDSMETKGVHIIASTTNSPRLADSVLGFTPSRMILTDHPPRVFGVSPASASPSTPH